MTTNNDNGNNKKENMSVQDAGRKGGESRAEKYSSEELSEQARRNAETVEKENPGFHSEIRKKGGEHSHGGHKKDEDENENENENENE